MVILECFLEVKNFLEHFAEEFGVSEVIHFNYEVMRVDFKDDGFVVEWKTIEVDSKEKVFDAVVVCNGHHTEPHVANDIPARDISKDIAKVAREVHLSSRSSDVEVSKVDGHENMWQHLKITRVFENGTVVFQDGCLIESDTILHCTGDLGQFYASNTTQLCYVPNGFTNDDLCFVAETDNLPNSHKMDSPQSNT
ncbi:flavin monooxygenase-like, FAD/NAD(P)-binding domain protein [Tanacetum coccineum]